MSKTYYNVIIEGLGQAIRRRVPATNAKKAAQAVADELGLTLAGKATTPERPAQWHVTDAHGTPALIRAER
ncbi:hypothetical protein [Deinococcus maricopensis]|uniref:Uncharacterized protein n=1 Tax=Deinococcus maricopensis (strain DSM 21211 / LMG 22137 / NRRL B-23946 / LB-34) TaxID=709986 RepID=E8UAQ8_DEIML|nr:hypothetical protein [Deinococcus maricopensis]ADV68147.1 hypothetical protein Deima_2512 [Deinococcus maricopensis DSM 21211]